MSTGYRPTANLRCQTLLLKQWADSHKHIIPGISMTRIFKIGVVTALFFPLAASAGATLEDIEDSVTKPVQEVATAVQQDEIVIEPSIGATSSRARIKDDSLINVVDLPPVYQFYSSDKAAELSYERNNAIFGLNNDRAVVSFLLNEERDNAVTAGIMFDVKSSPVKGLKLSFGPKLIAGLLSIENADVIGFAASVEALYALPIKKFPLRLTTAASYAPDILTFGQSDRIIDWNIRVGLPLTDNIDGFVGARYLQFDTRPGERKLDQQVHFGIRWTGKKSK